MYTNDRKLWYQNLVSLTCTYMYNAHVTTCIYCSRLDHTDKERLRPMGTVVEENASCKGLLLPAALVGEVADIQTVPHWGVLQIAPH